MSYFLDSRITTPLTKDIYYNAKNFKQQYILKAINELNPCKTIISS